MSSAFLPVIPGALLLKETDAPTALEKKPHTNAQTTASPRSNVDPMQINAHQCKSNAEPIQEKINKLDDFDISSMSDFSDDQDKKPASDRFDYVTEMWEKMAGNFELGYSNSVYLSERMSANRNFALAYFMNENNAFPENTNLLDVLEFYFQCCSLKINTNALSVVAATLANGGVCPLTGKQVISPETVKHCLSMMYSCGMYDYSGEFAFKIGLPAKSGVAGGIFVVIPNVMGICTYSPRLDQYGNSIRGVQFFTELTKIFNFHNFDNLKNTDHGKKDPRERKGKDDITSEQIIKYSSLGDVSALKRVSITNRDFSHGDYDNRTPLHLACSNGHLNVVKYLIEQGNLKDINPIDRWGGTPYDDAVRENYVEVTKYLTTKNGMSGDDLQK